MGKPLMTLETISAKKYLNVSFDRSMWCGYSGHCRVEQLIFNKLDVCLLCEHRIPMDIPKVLDDKHYTEEKQYMEG